MKADRLVGADTNTERELLRVFRRLTPQMRKALLAWARLLQRLSPPPAAVSVAGLTGEDRRMVRRLAGTIRKAPRLPRRKGGAR